MERRHLVAMLLCCGIYIVWLQIFAPAPRAPEPGAPDAADSEGTATGPEQGAEGSPEVGQADTGPQTEEAPPATASTSVIEDGPEESEPEVVDYGPAVGGEAEETLRFGNDMMEIEVSNLGGAITSLVLEGHYGDEMEPLDIVQTVDHKGRLLPLQLLDSEGPDQRLYQLEATDGGCKLAWSDGRGTRVEKLISVPVTGYGIAVDVRSTGALSDALLGVGTGLRDQGSLERANRFSTWGDGVVRSVGEIERYKRGKVKERVVVAGDHVDFAGLEDTYFISLLRPTAGVSEVVIDGLDHVVAVKEGEETEKKEKEEEEQVLRVMVLPSDGIFEGVLLAAPKEYNLMQSVGGGVEELLDFGFFGPISVFFLHALRWIYARVMNYGWAIVLLTLAIRVVLFPLMHASTVSMRRMQKIQPKVKAIQEKYKKNKRDPQVRAKMNQEMMELYKVEGVNPVGGCLPMLVQLPILWALYTLFAHAIELRHAPFMLWIQDLSAKDPYLVTPIAMMLTMWLQQKLAPQAGDPQQQKIMRLMPFIFGIMFMGFPSGLVLYWLSNNVITIAQQEVTLRLIGERGATKGRSGGKGKGR